MVLTHPTQTNPQQDKQEAHDDQDENKQHVLLLGKTVQGHLVLAFYRN
jgi:hypothetical protein